MKTKEGHWFEWEREATVHPILMCMEAWMEPMKKAYGRIWPTTIIIYNGDIVSWHNTWPELLDYGEYLIKRFSGPAQMKALVEDILSQAKNLDAMFKRFDGVDFAVISDRDLLESYKELHDRYVKWFIPGGLVEPIGHKGERMVNELLSGFGEQEKKEMFAFITTTTKESFSRREFIDLLRIAIAGEKGMDTKNLLEQHSRKYFWIHNNYFTTEVTDAGFFGKELEIALKKYPQPEAQIRKMEEELIEVAANKKNLVARLNLSDFNKNLIELLDMFAWYQDYRKEYVMQMLHYLDSILGEIGRRKCLSLKEMKYTLPSEVLRNTISKEKIAERMKRYLFYFDAASQKAVDGTGQWSFDKEKEIFHTVKHEDEVLEVSGMIASKGSARGKARVTMSATEAKNIENGEILITSMTTPDFVTAMKRAAAIVTNEGGILSHAAVVSREFGIPCIVGTKLATKIFKTGDLIEVDGELGVVRKVSE